MVLAQFTLTLANPVMIPQKYFPVISTIHCYSFSVFLSGLTSLVMLLTLALALHGILYTINFLMCFSFKASLTMRTLPQIYKHDENLLINLKQNNSNN